MPVNIELSDEQIAALKELDDGCACSLCQAIAGIVTLIIQSESTESRSKHYCAACGHRHAGHYANCAAVFTDTDGTEYGPQCACGKPRHHNGPCDPPVYR
jgi:hypothetical protein